RPLRAYRRQRDQRANRQGDRGPDAIPRRARVGRGERRDPADARRKRGDSVRGDRSRQRDRRNNLIRRGVGTHMSIEIIENIRAIEREKGIEQDALVRALEDALLAAYKKTPGAARHAMVELDDEGEFKVFAVEIPAELEERLLDEAREAKIDELERLEE